jgi:prepilin-type N-terminal cleavage/methylation domain-containing protein
MSKTSSPIKERLRDSRGVTLVELLVSAVILAVFLTGAIAMMRYMRTEQNNDYHRRQARTVVTRLFENVLNYEAFPGPYVFSNEYVAGDTLVNEPSSPARIDLNDSTKLRISTNQVPNVYLDRRKGHALIKADISVTAQKGNVAVGIGEGVTCTSATKEDEACIKSVETHQFRITVSWTETGGSKDSVSLTKRLAKPL